MKTLFLFVLFLALPVFAQSGSAAEEAAPGVALTLLPEKNARREYVFMFAGEHKDNNRCTLNFNRWDQNGGLEFYIEVTLVQPPSIGLSALVIKSGVESVRLLPGKDEPTLPGKDYAVFHLPQKLMQKVCGGDTVELTFQGSKQSITVVVRPSEALRNFARRCALPPATNRQPAK